MERSKEAEKTFLSGYNCSQTVLSIFAEDFGLSKETAVKVASGFGGGIAHSGETCGAVTGAIMAIGIKLWDQNLPTEENKKNIYTASQKFFEEFKTQNGSVVCKNLLGYDLSTTEGSDGAVVSGKFISLCPKLVSSAVEIVEKL